MADWTPADWGMFFTALSAFVAAVCSAIGMLLANLAKIRSETNAEKIDENTKITVAGTKEAAIHAKEAAATAAAVKTAADGIAVQLNGELGERIHGIVKEHIDPLVVSFREHNEQDRINMDKIELALKSLADKLPKT